MASSSSSIVFAALATTAVANGVDSVDITNSTISCNWQGPENFIGETTSLKLNVTDIVLQCADVCELAFASRVPDIAGHGVFISLLIQVALSSLLGPLLTILIWFMTLSSSRALLQRIPLLRALQLSVFKISTFLSLAHALSTITLSNQNSTIMETLYLSLLSRTEERLMTTLVWALWADWEINKLVDSTLGFWWGFYVATCAAVQMATQMWIALPDDTVSVYKTLSKACQTQHDVPHPYISSSISSSNESLKYLAIGAAIGAAIGVAISILGCVLAACLKRWRTALGKLVPRWLKMHGQGFFFTLALLFFTLGIVSGPILLADLRDTWRSVDGDAPGLGRWGFGQTMAILLWAPFVWTFLSGWMEYWRRPAKKVLDEEEMEAVDKGQLPFSEGGDLNMENQGGRA